MGGPENATNLQMQHLKLYMLGNMLQDVRLRNKVIEAFIDAYVAPSPVMLPGPTGVTYIYENTAQPAPMRRLLGHVTLSRVSREALEKNVSKYPRELVDSLAVSAAQKVATTSVGAFNEKRANYPEAENVMSTP